jgi:hypothetical protein
MKNQSEIDMREILRLHAKGCDLCFPKPKREAIMAKEKAKPKPVKDNTQVGAVRG